MALHSYYDWTCHYINSCNVNDDACDNNKNNHDDHFIDKANDKNDNYSHRDSMRGTIANAWR